MPTDKDYVKWFRNSAPYINAHRNRTFVLMFGGEAIEHPNFANIIHDIGLLNSLGVRLVLVHGSRPQIEERERLRGVTSSFHDGLRITKGETLDSVVDAAGSLRAQIEALLSMGLANSPMHGARIRVCSGNFVVARPLGVVDGVDFHSTGVVRRIDSDGIHRQLSEGSIVLLSPLGYSPTGEIFNLSLEEIAAQTAAALRADKLIAFSDQPGLLDESGRLIRHCELDAARQSNHTNYPWIDSIIQSCESGVPRAHLISYCEDGALLEELFSRDGSGTLIAQNHYERLRTATIDDVGGILELIEPLEADGTLVKRSRELLETEIDHFTVIERDGMVIAAAALYPATEERSGEIACVVTHTDYRRGDRGERLLRALEKKAQSQGLNTVFVLTTRTAHWFQEQGYRLGALQDLPQQRQQLYNYQRSSKIFLKEL